MDQQETRVYIVDDDQELCASLAWLLDSVNITSEYYFSVQSFLDEYRRDIPACLVLDVRMPEVGGFQLQEHSSPTNPRSRSSSCRRTVTSRCRCGPSSGAR